MHVPVDTCCDGEAVVIEGDDGWELDNDDSVGLCLVVTYRFDK